MKYLEPEMEIVEFNIDVLTDLELASQPTDNTGGGSGGSTGGIPKI